MQSLQCGTRWSIKPYHHNPPITAELPLRLPVAAAARSNTLLSDNPVFRMPQLLAAVWLLRALSERCTLRFAGRLALAQGLRFLGPTGAPTKLLCTGNFWAASAASCLPVVTSRCQQARHAALCRAPGAGAGPALPGADRCTFQAAYSPSV